MITSVIVVSVNEIIIYEKKIAADDQNALFLSADHWIMKMDYNWVMSSSSPWMIWFP